MVAPQVLATTAHFPAQVWAAGSGMQEGLRFVGVVYNLVAVGLVIMVFVIYLPRGLAGFRRSA